MLPLTKKKLGIERRPSMFFVEETVASVSKQTILYAFSYVKARWRVTQLPLEQLSTEDNLKIL